LKKDKKYLIDHRFYLALANGDKSEMENVLTELTSPKIAKVRNFEFAFTFTEHFIATHAVIYSKLAWRNGYQLNIDTPWIPKEWLPVEPLAEYPEPWEFMREFDIFTPFEGEWKDWSPKRNNT
ncbi:TPA: immunity 49 family protein, partial [Acinetobacter baumannii]|nr:Imm49 family immunity protein [Acinetobacter baumannii]MDO7416922.1 Imm49 family immunity protein [Acinetobacter baumannii]MDV7423973.1 Imm49 family immunity protein [Acinetobacter baumannii]HEE5406538.1 immunity 49 family protein [Acinetobacter baumannii]HEE5418786.1 immunity 49 family protein [Acinetobacter baumannii]